MVFELKFIFEKVPKSAKKGSKKGSKKGPKRVIIGCGPGKRGPPKYQKVPKKGVKKGSKMKKDVFSRYRPKKKMSQKIGKKRPKSVKKCQKVKISTILPVFRKVQKTCFSCFGGMQKSEKIEKNGKFG